MDNKNFEVIIIGGSYAGLSAAMALGRTLRRVLVIDSGQPCNRQTPHSHNFLTQDGQTPKTIASLSKQQVAAYDTIKFFEGVAKSGNQTKNGFEIITESNEIFSAKKIIFATGLTDLIPDIKGFSQCWGISIVHCPYCHGYENRDKKTAIMAHGTKAFHLVTLIHQLTKNITILTNGPGDFSPEQLKKLAHHHIPVIETPIAEIGHTNGLLNNIIFTDKSNLEFEVAYGSIPFAQASTLPVTMGCELNENGFIKIDTHQRTTVENVYACGDNSNMMRSVANAVYAGNITGAVVNGQLSDEQF